MIEQTCSHCGGSFPANDIIQLKGSWICAGCKPTFLQKLQEGDVLPGSTVYGGFWIRVGAKIIDSILIYILNLVVLPILTLVISPNFSNYPMFDNPGFAAFTAAYFASTALMTLINMAIVSFFLGKFSATPGKMVCGLKVVRPNGDKIGYGRAFGRSWAELLSSFSLCIGYIMVAFSEEKKSLHDLIVSTRVVKK